MSESDLHSDSFVTGTYRASERGDRFMPSGRELLAILAFWTFLGVLTAAGRLFDPRGPNFQVSVTSPFVALSFVEPYLWALLTPFVFVLSGRFNFDRGHRLRSALVFLAIGVVSATLVAVLTEVARQALFAAGPGGPRGEFRGGGRRRGGGPPMTLPLTILFGARWRVLNSFVIYAAVLAAAQARAYSMRYRVRREETVRLQAESARLQAQLAEARLDALRKQLDPHFLFNTLNAISSLVERDPRGVRRMISRLGELLRHSIEGAGEAEIPLRQELDLLRRYVEIMQVRFQGRLEVDVVAEPDVLDAMVPNLVLQPLVENAIKHGVSKVEGLGRIRVDCRREGESLVLRVIDNGRGLAEPGDDSSGVGLRNTTARLEQMYGSEQTFTLMPGASGGMVAEVRVPYHTRGDLRTSAAPDSSEARRV